LESGVSEIDWAEEPTELGGLVRSALGSCVGLGLLAGAGEAVGMGAGLKLSLGFDEALVLGATSVVLGAVLGVIFCLLAALPIWVTNRSDATRAEASVLGLVGGALTAWHLWPMGFVLLDQAGRWPSAAAFFAMPMGVVAVVRLNARYWIKRTAKLRVDGQPTGPSWMAVSGSLSVLMSLLTAFVISGRSYGSGRALQTDPPVLLITVDTLRRDHVSVYGNSPVQTPAIDELAREGVLFENAVTPFPETAPAHAAMFTGLHPVRTGMLSNGHALSGRYRTLAEMLGDEGYATAAFVSSFAVDSRTGLDQGFQAYDDDFFPVVRGLSSIRLANLGLRALMRFGDPLQFRSLLEREGDETLGRALGWLRDNGNGPFFLWVHIFEPHAPYETHGAAGAPQVDHRAVLANEPDTYDEDLKRDLRTLYAEEVAYTDGLVGDFLDEAREIVNRPMTIVFTADHGEMLGEHGVNFNHHGIFDETVRVPLIVVPHKGSPLHKRIPAQVRLMDIPNTVLAILGIDQDAQIESGDLTAFWGGTQDRDYGTFLMGRTGRSLDDGGLFGYRAAKADGSAGEMLKFIWSPDREQSWLFDLSMDPAEAVDISLSQESVVSALKIQVRKELGSAAPEGAGVSESEAEALKALGYLD
jgi:hypothetical protein